jgi:hypothetical protein
MKAFYADYRTGEHIDSAEQLELTFSESRRILNRIASGRGFFGVTLNSNVTLQFYQGDELSVELVDSTARLIDAAIINLPSAETALEAVFAGDDVRTKLDGSFIKWERSVIPN